METPLGRFATFFILAVTLAALFAGGTLLAAFTVSSSLSDGADQFAAGAQSQSDRGFFEGMPMVGTEALKQSSARLNPALRTSVGHYNEAIEVLLSRRPLDGGAWASLAAARQLSGADRARVLEALNFSGWTAPREIPVIRRRLKMELSLFPALPEEHKTRTAADFLMLGPFASLAEIADLRQVFTFWPKSDREDFIQKLVMREGARPVWLTRFRL